jgi:hypothetical protein
MGLRCQVATKYSDDNLAAVRNSIEITENTILVKFDLAVPAKNRSSLSTVRLSSLFVMRFLFVSILVKDVYSQGAKFSSDFTQGAHNNTSPSPEKPRGAFDDRSKLAASHGARIRVRWSRGKPVSKRTALQTEDGAE